jgi:hypothetical protein
LGELVQINGYDHRWFEDRGPACVALVYLECPDIDIHQ